MQQPEHVFEDDDPYVMRRSEGISFKPILSVENYVSLDIECIVAGCSDRTIRFLDPDTLEEVAKSTTDKRNVSFVAISGMSHEGDDPVIITGGKDSTIQVWDPTEGNVDRSIAVPTAEVRSISVYQGSRTLVVIGSKDGQVFVWDVVHNLQVAQFRGHMASVHCVCIALTSSEFENPEDDIDHLCIASGGADRSVRTWNIHTGKRVKKFQHQRSISSIIVTNKGLRPLLATAGVERVIKLWDLESGILLRSLQGHLDQINSITLWEGYQMLLISASADNTIRIYDMLSGECVCVLVGHRDAVLSVTTTNFDDPKIISSSEDLSIVQWDLKQIIADFYETEGEFIGSRNNRPAYNPQIEYEAPAELDRGALTKEDRKRIRKERKRAKRIKNLYHDWKKSHASGAVSTTEETFAEDIVQSSVEETTNCEPLGHVDESRVGFMEGDETKSESLVLTPENEVDDIPDEELDAWFEPEVSSSPSTKVDAIINLCNDNDFVNDDDEISMELSPSNSIAAIDTRPTELLTTSFKSSLARLTITDAITSAIQKLIPQQRKTDFQVDDRQIVLRRSKSLIRGIMENVLGLKSTVAIEVTVPLPLDDTEILTSVSAPPTAMIHCQEQPPIVNIFSIDDTKGEIETTTTLPFESETVSQTSV
jgi:WD40 repeat protein